MCIRDRDIGLICNLTQIDMLFLEKIKNIVDFEKTAAANIKDEKTLYQAKRMGFSDKAVAWLWGVKEIDVYNFRLKHGIIPVYKMIDSCASEFESYIPVSYTHLSIIGFPLFNRKAVIFKICS